MHHILIAGAGHIGTTIAAMLLNSGDYAVFLTDIDIEHSHIKEAQEAFPELVCHPLNATDEKAVTTFVKKHKIDAIVSCLPYFCNEAIAKIAATHDCHYFDLTEDVATTAAMKKLVKGHQKAFVPQCGTAPGFISIVANDLMQAFDKCEQVKLRVGALPKNPSNALRYALNWSTDGLINEYANPCPAIREYKACEIAPLADLENVIIDGLSYEAFNTSGGAGGLVALYDGKVKKLDYKTIRYPGHCDRMKFLMQGLRLKDHRDMLKTILEQAIPKTYEDVVVIYVSVTGEQAGEFVETNYVKKIYPEKIGNLQRSAIQIATASGLCSVMDNVLNAPKQHQGFVLQDEFSLQAVLDNQFGACFR